jgi:hypothetical protein
MVAVVQYYLASKRNRDSFPLKAIVCFTFVVDTFCTGTVCSRLPASTWYVLNLAFPIEILVLTSPLSAVYCNPLGYDPLPVWFFISVERGIHGPSPIGDFNFIRQANPSQYRSGAVSTALNGITAMIVQSFLIYRYWRMSVILFSSQKSAAQRKLCLGPKTITSQLSWLSPHS